MFQLYGIILLEKYVEKMKVKEVIFRKDNLIIIVLLFALALRIATMVKLHPDYNIGSDDVAFIESGLLLKQDGKITMHYVQSAKNMPGMTIIIYVFLMIFGDLTFNFWIAIKLFWISMGALAIYGVYKIIKMYANPVIASIICLLFCFPDFVWLDNLILTETPYMLCNIYLIYFSLKLAGSQKKRYFWFILVTYIVCLMIRPTICLFPLVLLVYLLIKKYDWKLMIKQGLIALGILLLVLLPWWYRNYKLFNEFIPLTYGTGDPMLLGTYQGYGYPVDKELDYNEYLNKETIDIKQYLGEDVPYTSKKQWAIFRDEENKAKFRMKKWWNKDKKSFIISYFLMKPFGVISGSFYWQELFNISHNILVLLKRIDLFIFIICLFIAIFIKNRIKEIIFIVLAYAYQVSLYSYTFAFDRYGQVLIFLRYIVIGWMIYEIIKKTKNKIGDVEYE